VIDTVQGCPAAIQVLWIKYDLSGQIRTHNLQLDPMTSFKEV
jgi:hypothetical protein